MSAERLPQMDQPFTIDVPHYSPEHLRYKNGRVLSDRDMAGCPRRRNSCLDRRDCLQAVGKKTLEVMELTEKLGRPAQSGDVQAIPIFRNPPDMQKLGRAVLKLVEHLADEDKPEAAENANDEGEREDGHAA